MLRIKTERMKLGLLQIATAKIMAMSEARRTAFNLRGNTDLIMVPELA